jgi:hypothetical protein
VGVLAHIVERLLDDAVQDGLDRGGKAAFPLALHLDPEPGAPGDSLGEHVESRHQPEIVENGGAQVVRQAAQLLLDPVEQRLHRLQPGGGRRREVASDVVERQVHGGEELSRLVVQLVGDAAGLILEELVQPSERGIGLAHGPMRHLEGGEALEHEAPRGLHRSHTLRGSALTGGYERSLQQRRDVEHAEALVQDRAPELVGFEQRGLSALGEMGLEGHRELLLERGVRRARHSFHFFTTTTVPWPTVDEISNSSIRRLTPGRPTPRRPAVE